jgi:hypothetical protein
MRFRGGLICSLTCRALAAAAPIFLAGCGYPGEPLPPALNRPLNVKDLAAVERGEKIIVHFTVPAKTTEDLPVKGAPELELRIGPMPDGRFDTGDWERNSERVPDGSISIAKGLATAEIPAQKFYGKNEVVGVRVLGPAGRNAGWSNFELVNVVAALQTPAALEAKDAPDAVRLDWHATAPEFRVYRRTAGEKGEKDSDFTLIGTSARPFLVDTGIEFGRTYKYFVQSVERTGEKFAESDLSDEITFKPQDRFAPAKPAGLTAVPGTRTIELVWERSPEKDFAAYRVYRDGQKISDETSPAFSDKDVKPGVRYKYQVSAVDTAGNESALSTPAETAIP